MPRQTDEERFQESMEELGGEDELWSIMDAPEEHVQKKLSRPTKAKHALALKRRQKDGQSLLDQSHYVYHNAPPPEEGTLKAYAKYLCLIIKPKQGHPGWPLSWVNATGNPISNERKTVIWNFIHTSLVQDHKIQTSKRAKSFLDAEGIAWYIRVLLGGMGWRPAKIQWNIEFFTLSIGTLARAGEVVQSTSYYTSKDKIDNNDFFMIEQKVYWVRVMLNVLFASWTFFLLANAFIKSAFSVSITVDDLYNPIKAPQERMTLPLRKEILDQPVIQKPSFDRNTGELLKIGEGVQAFSIGRSMAEVSKKAGFDGATALEDAGASNDVFLAAMGHRLRTHLKIGGMEGGGKEEEADTAIDTVCEGMSHANLLCIVPIFIDVAGPEDPDIIFFRPAVTYNAYFLNNNELWVQALPRLPILRSSEEKHYPCAMSHFKSLKA
ncbi:hypothetical protein BC829DRAFT_433537 [Chytridium lagenaria]|nr:hypothetical protein BC829DRAFT_433537 [Chytridium lagenaria]